VTTRTTIIETSTGSQPAPYQGDLWEGTIEFNELDAHDEWVPWIPPVLVVRQWVRRVTGFIDDDDNTDWFVPRLKHLAPTRSDPHIYVYRVQRPWDD
jgi:hypothetical protein